MVKSSKKAKEDILANTEGYVEFRSYAGAKGATRQIRPLYDSKTNWYKGVKRITPQLRESGKAFVDPDNETSNISNVTIKHGDRFDLGNEIDRMKLDWILEHTHAIDLVQAERGRGSTQTFYVYNKEENTKSRANNLETKDNAIFLLRKLTQDELYLASRLMGYRMTDKEPEEVRIFLRDLFDDRLNAVKNANKFLNVMNDNQKDIKKFIYKALDTNVITLSNRGEYKYKEHFIGLSFESVIAWVKNSENRDLLMMIREECGIGAPVNTPIYSRPEDEVKETKEVMEEIEEASNTNTNTKTTSTRGRKKST